MRSPAPSDHDHALGDVDEVLTTHGLRRTPQRRVTLQAIAELAGHATAEQIVERVRAELPTISPSTVYRTLGTLEDAGVLCHAHLGHTASVYHVGTAGLHQHLVCERCGDVQQVTDAAAEAFAEELRKRFGFRANLTHFAVLGECRSCTRGAATRARRPKAAPASGRAGR